MPKETIKPNSKPLKATPAAEIRRHYFLDQYVVIAPKRGLRPDSFKAGESSHQTETATSRPIEQDPAIEQIKDPSGKWLVKVISNAFPALSLDNPLAYGKQEIVIETPKHNVEFSELPLEQIERVFQAYQQRLQSLKKLPGIRYVQVFKNDGPKAGASIAHAHSQITALPFIPPKLIHEAEQIQAYTSQNQTCPHCDVISWELDQKVRVVFEDQHIVAIAPYADDYPFGVWVMPRLHRQRLADLLRAEKRSLGVALKMITARLDNQQISFNFSLQESLDNYDQHFVVQVEPRSTIWAGLEISTGVIINPVAPEYAALWYKNRV